MLEMYGIIINFPQWNSCRIDDVEGVFLSVFTNNHVLRPWKRPIRLTPGGALSRDDCGSPARHKGPGSQEQRLMAKPIRDDVTSYYLWTYSCTMLDFGLMKHTVYIVICISNFYVYLHTYVFNFLCFDNPKWCMGFLSINSMLSLIVYPMYPVCTILILYILSVVIASGTDLETSTWHQLGDIKLFILDDSLRIMLHQTIPSYRTEKTCFGKHLFPGSSSPRECYR